MLLAVFHLSSFGVKSAVWKSTGLLDSLQLIVYMAESIRMELMAKMFWMMSFLSWFWRKLVNSILDSKFLSI